MNLAVMALAFAILASPCAADDSASWKLVAHSNLIVVGTLGSSEPDERPGNSGYARSKIKVDGFLKGYLDGEVDVRYYTQRQDEYGPKLATIKSSAGTPVIAFVDRAGYPMAHEERYFAGGTDRALRNFDYSVAREVAAEILDQRARLARFDAEFVAKRQPLYAEVRALIDQLTVERTELDALEKLEALGDKAVPAIICMLDDRRPLAVRHFTFRNRGKEAFEATRHTAGDQVIDALSLLLNQMTGDFYGGHLMQDRERQEGLDGWRIYLSHSADQLGAVREPPAAVAAAEPPTIISAAQAYERGQIDIALEQVSSLVGKSELELEALKLRSRILAERFDVADAKRDFGRWAALDTKDAEPLLREAELLAALKPGWKLFSRRAPEKTKTRTSADLGKAWPLAEIDTLLDSASARNPRSSGVRLRRAGVYVTSRRWLEALTETNHALAMDPASAAAWAQRAQIHDRFARNLDSVSGSDYPTGYTVGELTGEYHPAMMDLVIDDYRRAIAVDPRPEWRLARADAIQTTEHWHAAQREYLALAKDMDAAIAKTRDDAEQVRLRKLRDMALGGAARYEKLGQDWKKVFDEEAAAEKDRRAVEERVAATNRDPKSVPDAINKIATIIARLYADEPERFKPIDAGRIDGDTRRFMDQTSGELAALGFKPLADVYSERDEKLRGRATPARVLRTDDGRIAVALYREASPQMTVEVVEFESTTSSGKTYRTSNIGGVDFFRNPESIAVETTPLGTAAPRVLALHRSRMAVAEALEKGLVWTSVSSAEDLTARSEAQRKAKRAFARSRGWITNEELKAMIGSDSREQFVDIRAQLIRTLQ